MFRRSKRDKDKVRSSTTQQHDLAPDTGSSRNGSLKRHSKLFLFGKKKKNLETLQDPESPDTDGIRVEEIFQKKLQKTVSQPINSVVEVNNENKSQTNSVNKSQKQAFRSGSSASVTPRRLSNSGSLSLDLGTDTSLFFQSFADDVLRATEEKLRGVDLKLPDIKTEASNDSSRTVTVKRNEEGDFGFALRRSTLTNGDAEKPIHFVESAKEDLSLGLLPGDRLVSVGGINVENASREEIIQKVASSGDSVELKVVPVPELSELSSRTAVIQKHSPQLRKSNSIARSGSIRTKLMKNSRTDLTSLGKVSKDSEKVWLVHQAGFSSGVLSKAKDRDGENAYKVKLDHGGEIVEVEEDGVEKVNPPQFDRTEDLSTLRYLNESGCLHTLRQRYAGNLTHTYAGKGLIVIRPKQKLGVYTEKVMHMFQGCKHEDMPPHIYAVAQTSHHSMFASNVNQSIIFQGNAGSGKTFNARQVIRYLTTVTAASDCNATAIKMDAALSLIESFTHARTVLSHNASFGAFLYTLDFDSAGLVIGSSIQNIFLDKGRVSRNYTGESSYRIFYELLDGCKDKLRQDLMLDSLPLEGNILFDFEQKFADETIHSSKWHILLDSFKALNISNEEIKGVLSPIAAALHLGAAGIFAGQGKPYFANPAHAQKAALVLGTTEENLTRLIFTTSINFASRSRSGTLSRTSSTASRASVTIGKTDKADVLSPAASVMSIDSTYESILYGLESFTAGLYVEAFTALMRLINRAINTAGRVKSVINILDGPGFQNKTLVSKNGSIEDLRYNYCCEKLQWLMHFTTFTAQIDRYNRENIDCSFNFENVISPDATIAAMDRVSVDRNISNSDLGGGGKGIFWLIEEEAVRSNANEISLVEKIKSQHMGLKGGQHLVSTNVNLPEMFMVSHLQNSVPVKYNVNSWLKRVRDHPTMKMAYSVLADSTKEFVTELYAGHPSGTFYSEGGQPRGNRRRSPHAAASSVRRNSVSMQLKIQMDRVLEILDRTMIHFVYCFLPDVPDGLFDPLVHTNSTEKQAATLNVPFVRQQLKSSYLLESMRIHRQELEERSHSFTYCRSNLEVPQDAEIQGFKN